jgi:hypothetical protein
VKTLIGILIVLAVIFFGWRVYDYWVGVDTEREAREQARRPPPVVPERLEGLPSQLEPSLQEAQKKGAAGLKAWLDQYKRSPLVKDPRLAWIELDYVVGIAAENPLEAKRVFSEVKKRTPPESPVYPRIKDLEKTYE